MNSSRRSFLKTSAAFSSGLLIVPSSVLGDDERPAPSERITLACIGTGNMGTNNLKAFLQDERVQVVAICDVDEKHRANAIEIAGLKPSDGYGDFRQVLAREDIDAVMIATPDHWHSYITIAAANAGKDIYCEKPLAASIREGRVVSDVVQKNKRVLQCGTWRRSGLYTRWACELVQNEYIGELKSIEVGVLGDFVSVVGLQVWNYPRRCLIILTMRCGKGQPPMRLILPRGATSIFVGSTSMRLGTLPIGVSTSWMWLNGEMIAIIPHPSR